MLSLRTMLKRSAGHAKECARCANLIAAEDRYIVIALQVEREMCGTVNVLYSDPVTYLHEGCAAFGTLPTVISSALRSA